MRAKKKSEFDGRPKKEEDEKFQRVSIYLPVTILEKLKREAIKRDISFTGLIREKLEKAGV